MDYLTYIDFLSPDITLYFNGKRSHSSNMSYILSIISIILIIIISFYYSIDFIYKLNPSSFFYKTFVEDVGIFPVNNISDNKNLSSIFYHFISFDKPIDKRAFQIIGINKPAEIIKNNDISEYNHWIYDSCNGTQDIKDFFNYLNEYESIYLNYGLCISKYYDSDLKTIINKNESNFLYPTVAHGNTNKNEIIYLIGIKKCENNTIINNNTCYDNEIIENIIKEYKYFSIYFLDHHIDLDNYKYPIKYLFHNIVRIVNVDSYSSSYLHFELTSILSYFGFFFQSKKIFNTFLYYTFQGSSNIREGKNKKLIGLFIFLFNNSLNVYIRKYKMLTDILVVIAGISKVIIFIIKILYFIPYNVTIFDDIKNIINKKYKKYFLINKNINKLNLNKSYNNYIEKKISNKININEHDISNNILSNYSNINKSNNFIQKKKSNLFNEKFINENKNLFEINVIKKLCNLDQNKNNFFIFFVCLKKKNLIYNQVYKFRKKILSEEELFLLHISVIFFKTFLKKEKHNKY